MAKALHGKYDFSYEDGNIKINFICILLEKMTILIYLLLYPLAKIPIIKELWETFVRSYSQSPVGFLLRAAYYRTKLRKMGNDVFINVGVMIWNPERVEIGNNVHLNVYVTLIGHDSALIQIGSFINISSYTMINGRGGVVIEDYSGISNHCAIYSVTHHHQFPDGRRALGSMAPLEDQNLIIAPIRIHKYANVRWGSIILPGVEIGEWSVVAACSLVKNSVPPNIIVGGVPAKRISEYKEGSEISTTI